MKILIYVSDYEEVYVNGVSILKEGDVVLDVIEKELKEWKIEGEYKVERMFGVWRLSVGERVSGWFEIIEVKE